jgi:steroid delta-isomerase-like uncharacterized protein
MSSNQNVDTFTRWIEAHRAHDLDSLVTFLTDDVTIQSAAGKDMPPARGKGEARHHWQTIYTTFPDFRMDAVDLTAEGDTLFAEISHGGTMEGPMGPRQPTGKSYRTQAAFRFDFSDGKIRSILSYWDTAAMAKQLGLVG